VPRDIRFRNLANKKAAIVVGRCGFPSCAQSNVLHYDHYFTMIAQIENSNFLAMVTLV
jgi:hypothetical protein